MASNSVSRFGSNVQLHSDNSTDASLSGTAGSRVVDHGRTAGNPQVISDLDLLFIF